MNLRVSLPATLLFLASPYTAFTMAEEQGYQELLKTRSSLTMVSEATYSCTFTNLWTSRRHPTLYPGNAHWSSPVLTSHSEEYTMWEPGALASPGVEVVAETGSTSTLVDEFLEATNMQGHVSVGETTFNNRITTQTLPDITVSGDNHLMSAISMIAPSPDWFSGFYNYDPRIRDRTWAREFILQTFPWDAGTEQGSTYSINNDPEAPHRPIFQLTNKTVPDTGVLMNRDRDEVLPVVTWHCMLVNDVPDPSGPRIGGPPGPDSIQFP